MSKCGCEPPLSEMLTDPMTLALMQSDGVDEGELRRLLVEAKERLAKAETRGN